MSMKMLISALFDMYFWVFKCIHILVTVDFYYSPKKSRDNTPHKFCHIELIWILLDFVKFALILHLLFILAVSEHASETEEKQEEEQKEGEEVREILSKIV